VDAINCAIWVATLLLETQTQADQTIPVADFLESWRNHLLEEWRELPTLELIQVRVNISLFASCSNGLTGSVCSTQFVQDWAET
jgi:hypothetical protein